MNKREIALTPQEEKEIGITNHSSTHNWAKESSPLFDHPIDHSEPPYSPPSDFPNSPAFSELKSGQLRIETEMKISDIGEIGDPDSKKYNLDKMLEIAEQDAKDTIENLFTKEALAKYKIDVEAIESIDTIQTFSRLTLK